MVGTLSTVGVIHICGSVTTWTEGNPSYCVLELDSEYLLPVKRQTFAIDLTKSNSDAQIAWDYQIDWKEAFTMKDLSPSSYS